jgi:hypothetical protein
MFPSQSVNQVWPSRPRVYVGREISQLALSLLDQLPTIPPQLRCTGIECMLVVKPEVERVLTDPHRTVLSCRRVCPQSIAEDNQCFLCGLTGRFEVRAIPWLQIGRDLIDERRACHGDIRSSVQQYRGTTLQCFQGDVEECWYDFESLSGSPASMLSRTVP